MKVKDLIKMNVDVEVYDSLTQEIVDINFVGPVELTEEGKEKFKEVLEYVVVLHEEDKYAIVKCSDEEPKTKCKKTDEFFKACAGYCSSKDYDKWFKEINQIEIRCPINIDKFDENYICWMEVMNIPEQFKTEAKQIDGEYYDSTCFGICVVKDTDDEDIWNVITESHVGELFYTDNLGNQHWMKYNLTEKKQAIDFCKNYIEENNL